MNEIRFIDLFSGVGGFRLGLERASSQINAETWRRARLGDSRGRGEPQPQGGGGRSQQGSYLNYRCVWSCDNNKYANQVYTKQFGKAHHYTDDIRGINPTEIPNFDLLCAGFPCQSFSTAGKRKGFQDTRGTLFFEICRIIEAKRPSLLLLENVKGLLNHDGGRTFTVILQSLDELGYWIEWQVLNSKYFGVPQNRERVFIIGHLRGASGREIFPIGQDDKLSNSTKEQKTVGALSGGGHSGGLHSDMTILGVTLANTSRYKEGYNRTPVQSEGISWALNAAGDQGILEGVKIRRLTPIECERLQGFPDGWTEHGIQKPDIVIHDAGTDDEWTEIVTEAKIVKISDTQRYKCLGNAVTVNIIEFLGERIIQSLG